MDKLSYNYHGRPSRQATMLGAKLRLAAIFVVIAGLTAAGVFFIIPDRQEPAPAAEPAAETGNALDIPAESGNAPAASGRVIDSLPGDTAEPGDIAEEPSEEAAADESEDSSETAPALDESGIDFSTAPVKGKPWEGDPVVDEPTAPPPGDAGELRRLTDANLALFEQKSPNALLEIYLVRPGDNLSRIASRFHTTVQAIKYLNDLPAEKDTVYAGQRLLLCPGPWRVDIDKEARLLTVSRNGAEFALFDVGVGRMGSTPAGEFVISARLRHPVWYAPNGVNIPWGDPDNPLGDYFLKLADVGNPDKPLLGYGIHGTQDESSVSKSLSSGCIRMRNAEVEKLYLLLPNRTAVGIH